MRPFLFLVAFAAAIWAVNEGWASLRTYWAAPSPVRFVATLGYAAVFVAAFLYLGLGVYAADRAAGRVRRRIGLYERMLRGRSGARGARSGGEAPHEGTENGMKAAGGGSA